MKGAFWNIRGLNKVGRKLMLSSFMRSYHLDFVGVIETKKESFEGSFLKSFTGNTPFSWNYLPAVGSAGGVLVGFNSDLFNVVMQGSFKFLLNCLVTDKKSNFTWRCIVVYGSPYEEGKQEFLDELDKVLMGWHGPTLVGGDFNLVRVASDKSNGVINSKWAGLFNSWVNKWALLELNDRSKTFTW